jgi:glycosyltransferase involved in cell wall biosynthesis
VTFQHDPDFQHLPDAFDGSRSRLFCYSAEMADRYATHRPIQTLSVQFGLDEDRPLPATAGEELMWLGRIHRQKAPHLAAKAARLLGRRLRIIGPVLDCRYAAEHAAELTAPHVELAGELSGPAKLDVLRTASTLVYTCARDYTEAGAAVFGEALRSGTPVAALVWRSGTCAHAALCAETGTIAQADPDEDDETAASRLATAIAAVEHRDPHRVQQIGVDRFDPVAHFRTLAAYG